MKKIILAIFTILIYCSIQQINAQKKEEKDKIRNSYDLKKINDLEKKYTKKKSRREEKGFCSSRYKRMEKDNTFSKWKFCRITKSVK